MSKYGVISGPYFPTFGLNTERYKVSLRIQSECGEIRTTNISVFGHFSRSANMKFAGHGEPFWHTNMLLLAVEFSGSSHQETQGPSV